MAIIRSVTVLLRTADVDGAGTDGDVYVGVAGREFFVDSDANDFERGSSRVYRFGNNAEFTEDLMLNKAVNDPRDQNLTTEDADRLPVYIRFSPAGRDDNWRLELAAVGLNSQPPIVYWSLPNAPDGIWLGTRAGLWLHLPREVERVPDHGRRLDDVKILLAEAKPQRGTKAS
jgi:hypothetical protein